MLDAQDLPDLTIILSEGRSLLLLGDAARPVDATGYGPPERRPTGMVTVLTPATSRTALGRGYLPVLHPSL